MITDITGIVKLLHRSENKEEDLSILPTQPTGIQRSIFHGRVDWTGSCYRFRSEKFSNPSERSLQVLGA
jgi:hypothetical protein